MAGEIQLNSTTMATESSGSITAQLDTIRPNTTNGSLTLQGDSSDAGVTGLTIDASGNATFAQTISGGTIGSSVVFPAGKIVNVQGAIATDTSASDYTFSVTSNDTYVGSVTLGTDYSTSVLSSASNKLIVCVSLIAAVNATALNDHWRIHLTGTGISNYSTYNRGYPLNQNFYYKIDDYFETNLSAQILVTPGQNNPLYRINCLLGSGSSTLIINNINYVFMEVQA